MAKRKLKKRKHPKKVYKKPREKLSPREYMAQHKSLFVIGGMLIAFFTSLAAACFYVVTNYTVLTVYVEGNIHYTNEEIIDMVMEGRYGNNSLLLSLKYRDKGVGNIPFVEKMDISVIDPHTIKVEVYEKALAGCVEYLDKYMYFDKDGIIVESSDETTVGVPTVAGLSFDHVIVNEPLPVEDAGIFKSILSITQLVNKYNLSADRIYFGSDGSITLYFGKVRAALGSEGNLDEKIMRLQYLLPDLTGKSGVIRLENYTEDTKNITFEPDQDEGLVDENITTEGDLESQGTGLEG